MIKKYTLSFREVEAPIAGRVTKFGGQPAWLTAPQWPVSRATGEPMRFLCQIALDAPVFGDLAGRMAYLFISDGETFVDNTYDPDGGENALIIQPGHYEGKITGAATGPTLEKAIDNPARRLRDFFAAEYAVELLPGEDPDEIEADAAELAEDEIAPWDENKIGGAPAWFQGPEYLSGGPWKLLLQFDSASVPFDVNFGDAGIGYAFIALDGQTGKFLWQCA